MDLQPPVNRDDRAQGAADAPVTLVEFGDYQCPYCAQAQPIVRGLISEYGEGLRYVFRNYPLVGMHPDAMNAALVAESAETKNFWVLHDLLFDNQDALDEDSLIAYATTAGVSENDARGGLGGSTRTKIEGDMRSGDRSGVQGTPSYYINGLPHTGGTSREGLDRALRAAGARSTTRSFADAAQPG